MVMSSIPAVLSLVICPICHCLVSSPFMNLEARVRELEACFREMWRRFLHNEPVTDLSVR